MNLKTCLQFDEGDPTETETETEIETETDSFNNLEVLKQSFIILFYLRAFSFV
jgi:hypothetical protein